MAIKVRQGLNYVLDRNDLREYTTGVKKGEKDSPCEFISGPFVQSSPYYNRAIPVVENSQIAKADSLFKRAGLVKAVFGSIMEVLLNYDRNESLSIRKP